MEQSMGESKRDIWSEWLLNRRQGGNNKQTLILMKRLLFPIRDKVLFNADMDENETLLDIGCGDGLIAFGALDKSDTAKVIFSDISQDILDHDKTIAQKLDVMDRCSFICNSAVNLSDIDNESVDTATARSVLIYIKEKQKAFNELYRVLKPGGRLSIFEPINKYSYIEPADCFWGYNVAPVLELSQKVKALYDKIQPPESDTMLDFDERDLVTFVGKSGFKEIHLELQFEKKQKDKNINWEFVYRTAPNPLSPTLEEALQQALTPFEMEKFIKHLLPLVESHQGMMQATIAYLWAVK
jgi:arsenite methyltransferase